MPKYKVEIEFSGVIEKEIIAENEKEVRDECFEIDKYDIGYNEMDVDFIRIISEEPTEEELEEKERLEELGQEKINYKELEEKGQLNMLEKVNLMI